MNNAVEACRLYVEKIKDLEAAALVERIQYERLKKLHDAAAVEHDKRMGDMQDIVTRLEARREILQAAVDVATRRDRGHARRCCADLYSQDACTCGETDMRAALDRTELPGTDEIPVMPILYAHKEALDRIRDLEARNAELERSGDMWMVKAEAAEARCSALEAALREISDYTVRVPVECNDGYHGRWYQGIAEGRCPSCSNVGMHGATMRDMPSDAANRARQALASHAAKAETGGEGET